MHTTPWGIPIGNLLRNNDSDIPVILDSRQTGFCLHYQSEDESRVESWLENIVLGLVAALPLGALHIHLFDYTLRKRFPYLKDLEAHGIYHAALNSSAAESAFNHIESLVQHRHQELLGRHAPDLASYNAHSERPEPWHLLLINADDYPDERSAQRRWQELHQAAAAAGILIIAFTTGVHEERQPARHWLREALPALHLAEGRYQLPDQVLAALMQWYPFEPLSLNKDQILDALQAQAAQQQEESALKDYLDIRIGTAADGASPFHLRLGYRKGNHHALLAGRSGSGKTAMLNNLILRIGEQYDSSQLRLYLMDYKEGVEFQAFREHPNVVQIHLDNTDIAAAESLLREFAGTCRERSGLLRQEGLSNIDAYNARYPHTPLPRLLLIIDECQAMFGASHDYARQRRINDLLKTVAKQGRSFGVHLLLASQNLQNVALDEDVRAEIGLRMTFRLSDNAAQKILAYDNLDAAADLGQYQLLYNDNAGHKNANHRLQTDAPQDIDATIRRIRASRPAHLCLSPHIVQSANPAPAPDTAEPAHTAPTFAQAAPMPERAGRAAEMEALEQLRQLAAGEKTP